MNIGRIIKGVGGLYFIAAYGDVINAVQEAGSEKQR